MYILLKTSFSKIYLKTEVVLLSRAVIDDDVFLRIKIGLDGPNEKRKISREFMRKKKKEEEEEEEEEENRGVSQ